MHPQVLQEQRATIKQLQDQLAQAHALGGQGPQLGELAQELSQTQARLLKAETAAAHLGATQAQLAEVRQQVAELNVEFAQTQGKLFESETAAAHLASTQAQLAEARLQLAEANVELAQAQARLLEAETAAAHLAATQAQLADSNQRLAQTEARLLEAEAAAAHLASTQAQLAEARQQLATAHAGRGDGDARGADAQDTQVCCLGAVVGCWGGIVDVMRGYGGVGVVQVTCGYCGGGGGGGGGGGLYVRVVGRGVCKVAALLRDPGAAAAVAVAELSHSAQKGPHHCVFNPCTKLPSPGRRCRYYCISGRCTRGAL